MKEANRIKAQEQIRNNRVFRTMNHLQQILDEYYLDGIIGLIPYGIGDLLTAIFGLLYIWFAFGKVKSLPLTLAILNNSLRDVFLGLIPFYIGNVIDFFHKSNTQNMRLITGFVEGNEQIIREVNKKAVQSGFFIVIFLILIVSLIFIIIYLTDMIFRLF
ncbi:DUF4112 domain-containing protein [Prevotella corporis]|uniref:DUF4112 domain-containing protein n=1 Tax=Prevotella corporis TaxID=28128 RepID=UPI00236736EF|nr:DUF4112 domain-containing protein [Prevotella corporis]MDQ7738042.1 DUF4112 domain-containing protein [Prevotella corporis]